MSETIQDKILAVLETVKPRLAMHAGGVEFVGFDEASGEVQVKMTGMCDGCPLSQMTLKMGIEALMVEEIPEVKRVVNVYATA